MAKIDPKKQYRATETLFMGRARAANVGDIIEGTTIVAHDEKVDEHSGWADKVELLEDPADALDINQSAAKVLAWVGEDASRAATALVAEQEKGEKARSGLVADLEAIATAPTA